MLATTPPASLRTGKILIVDDEPKILKLLSRYFSRQGHDVRTTTEPQEALQLVLAERYDVLVLDHRMPGLTGLELFKRVLRLHKDAPPEIILMTAHSLRELNDNDDLPGLFAIMQKPFDMLEMKETIFKALEQGYNTSLYGKGSIANNRIRYIIETSCVQKRNSALRVSRNSQRGAIYIKDGRVIHAECGNLSGETALYSILDWVDGRYEIGRDNSQVPRTILRDWHTIKCQ